LYGGKEEGLLGILGIDEVQNTCFVIVHHPEYTSQRFMVEEFSAKSLISIVL